MATERPGEEGAREGASAAELDARCDALRALVDCEVPFLMAGAYASFEYTGIRRDTKDIDVFVRRDDVPWALAALERAGFRSEIEDPLWLAKGYRGEWFVDVIHSSGNGVASVDDLWFEHARPGEVMGVPVLLAPPEEVIWSKAFVCERERFDGHDVIHMLNACGRELDWERLLARFGEDWEVLLAHLVLFRYAFPSERSTVPERVLRELLARSYRTLAEGDLPEPICRGTLLSKTQYRHAVEEMGYVDARAARTRSAPAAGEGRGDEPSISPGGGG